MTQQPTFSFGFPDEEDRLRELILYIAGKLRADTLFGATKLNKLLWLADFIAYADHGEPLTGVQYQRLTNGPAPRRLVPIRVAMIKANEAKETTRQQGGRTQKRLVPLRNADVSMFKDWQLQLVDQLIEATKGVTAQQLSAFSHGAAWKSAAKNGELIPYEAAFLSDRPPDDKDETRTAELAEQHGWSVR